jgi:hypothetical protein
MGLDMYLNAKTSHYRNEKVADLTAPLKLPKGMQIHAATLSVEVAYWRKANAIHQWFVDNVQGGRDDCGTYHVTTDHIKALRKTILDVIDSPDMADDLLPTQGGFFFGGTEYDDYYFEALKVTHDKLGTVLDFLRHNPDFYLEYQSSW